MNIVGKLFLLLLICSLLGPAVHTAFGIEVPVTPYVLLPEQNIEVSGEKLPQWKIAWDKARKNALQGNFDEALRLYKALLVMKSNLDEARWEMTRLLIHLKRWPAAAESLEILTGSDPENTVYISSLGKVMWEMEQYERATALFKKIYLKNPTDQLALAGLVEGLMKLGRKVEALPYLEQLSQQEPTNRGVRGYLASVYYDEGNYEKAKPHLTILARSDEVEADILHKTAETYEHLGHDLQASFYWERYVARDPENQQAHAYLARYYEQTGQFPRAVQHLQNLLEHYPDDATLLERLGRMSEKTGDYAGARLYYERYLTKVPEDKEVQRTIAGLMTATDMRKSPPAREHYPIAESSGKFDDLKKSLLQMDKTVRYRKAAPLYRQLIEFIPGDREIINALADDLLIIAGNEDAGSMRQYLADIAGDNLDIYNAMAELFRQLNREDALLAVLRKVHELAPADNVTVQELAILSLRKNELLQSRVYFAKLPDENCSDINCLQARALLWEKLHLPEHELRDYENLLKKQPDRYKIRFRVIYLAANMGMIDTAVYHAGYLQGIPSVSEDPGLKILLADTYRKSGYFRRARQRYLSIIDALRAEKTPEGERFRIRSWFGVADSFKEAGLFYEAEQALRTALAEETERIPILEALFELVLEEGKTAEAEVWLGALLKEIDSMPPETAAKAGLARKKHSLQIRMLSARGDYRQAIALYGQASTGMQEMLRREDNHGDLFANAPSEMLLDTRQALNLMYAGQMGEAEKAALALREKFGLEAEPLVLLERIYRAAGKDAAADMTLSELKDYAAEDFGRQLVLADLCRKYDNLALRLEASETAAKLKPYSLSAQRQYVEALVADEEYEQALDKLIHLQVIYPDNSWLLSRQAELMVKVGRFAEALAVGNMILSENPVRTDVILRQARILWEMNRWRDSVGLYERVLNPSVKDILAEKLQEIIPGYASEPENHWWRVMTFTRDVSLSMPELVMSPMHAVDFSENGRAVNSVAAQYYAQYCWQQRFAKELAVRRSVMRWEYFHAANMLEDVINEYGSDDFLLFDLAGLYSRLERLGDEAVVYRKLRAGNADFPGLAEAVQRNNLKRRPQIFLSYTVKEENGWKGYKAVRQEIFNTGGGDYKSVNRKWGLDLARISYESTDNGQNVWGLRTMLKYDAKVSQAFDLSLGGGVEDLGVGYKATPLYYGAVTGKIADEVRAVLSVHQDVTDDTIAGLTRNIKRRDYKAGIMLDIIPRIVFGGYRDVVDYSDSNMTKISSFWASYIFLPEPILLKVSYNYNLYDSDEGRQPGLPGPDGFAPDDHPYWAPQNYWMTRFSFYFKHQLSNDALARGVPSYYTLEYSLGYDSEDHDLHELKGSINIEIAKNYILGASYGFVDLDVYKNKETFVTIMYRW